MATFYWPTVVAGSVGPGAFPLLAPNGSAAAPSYSFSSSASSGMYLSGAAAVGFSAGGTKYLEISSIGVNVTAGQLFTQNGSSSLPGICVGTGGTDGFYLSASNVIGIACGATSVATLSASGCAIKGTNTTDSAAAGYVGQYIESVISTFVNVPGATTVWGNLTSISLTAGDWDVSMVAAYAVSTAIGNTIILQAISINSGATTTDQIDGSNQISTFTPNATRNSFGTIASYRISVGTTTTVYGKANLNYSAGNPQYQCRISARRVR